MSTYAVGDIQGCLKPLKCLLQRVQFNADRDRLWCVGDLINRGPKCLKTLRFLYERRDNLTVVLGNHDLHLLAVAAGVRSPSASDTLDEILQAPDLDTLANWLIEQPLVHTEHGHTLVHAGIPPQWSVADANDRAREVEAALRSERRIRFLEKMYGNDPSVWSDDLTGIKRLRVITNYLTRMRYCTRDGELDLVSKGPEPPCGGRKVTAWFSHAHRKTADDRIIFGHWASLLGHTDNPNAIGLDTGCVWGGSLTLYELETGTRTRCHCDAGRPRLGQPLPPEEPD